MKITVTMGVFALLVGCVHAPSPARLSEPATEADANAIAKAAVRAKEHWKKVDSVARKIDTSWKVFVCPVPSRVAGPYVNVIVDESGQVTQYERQPGLK